MAGFNIAETPATTRHDEIGKFCEAVRQHTDESAADFLDDIPACELNELRAASKGWAYEHANKALQRVVSMFANIAARELEDENPARARKLFRLAVRLADIGTVTEAWLNEPDVGL